MGPHARRPLDGRWALTGSSDYDAKLWRLPEVVE